MFKEESIESTVLGKLARRASRRLVKIYYPRIEVSGFERIPTTGPVLLCGNHPNSLVDPIVIGIACRRPVRFMAKAPLFRMPVIGPVMHALGMIPAYRGSDDAKQVRRNFDSLDSCVHILLEGHAVGIFPEGKSHDALQVEMVRSGVARIAVQTVEKEANELLVVPLGLNYARKEQFRSPILVEVGQPIEVENWLAEQNETGRKAIRALTNELEKRLKLVAIHLDEPGWEPMLEDLEVLIRAGSLLKSVERRKQIANAINFFLASDRPRAEAMADEMQRHRKNVLIQGLSMDSAVLQESGFRLFCTLFFRIAGLLIGLCPALLGVVFHLVPFAFTRVIASFATPPGRTAISLYRLLFGIPIYAIWYVIAGMFAARMNVSIGMIAVMLFFAPAAGVFALTYWPQAWRSATQAWRQLLCLARQADCRNLRKERDTIRTKLISMADEYTQRDADKPLRSKDNTSS